jgi:4-amino-4-deoxy-L-arabinose transferase-like glycosyltransferase
MSQTAETSLLDAVLPPSFRRLITEFPLVKPITQLDAERQDLVAVALLALALFVPWLGSVGLWDPWEPHYGEVAREMIWRHDYVNPWWQSAPFYSKPPLLMWMMSVGMNLLGIGNTTYYEPVPYGIEWAMRLPVVLLATAGVGVLTLAIRRIFGRRIAFLTAFVLITSPFYFFLARQCTEDMPLLACIEICLGSFMLAEFTYLPGPNGDATTRRASPFWWYAMYAAAAFATLAKESLGIAVPGLVILTYLMISQDWSMLRRARLLPGLVLFLLIASPWYLSMLSLRGIDDEQMTFGRRLIWDNFLRLEGKVHTTTPSWTFSYFVEQIGWGFFPWVMLLPGAIATVGRASRADQSMASKATLFFAGWAVSIFCLFSLSGTKFHHYVVPVLPALAFGCAYYADTLWREGLDRFIVPNLIGLGLFVLIASNLYQWHDDAGVHSGLKHFTDLFVYQYNRPYPFGFDNPESFAVICAVGGTAVALAIFWESRRGVFVLFSLLSVAIAVWGSWFYWTWMSPHWSQRDEFWAYYREAKPNEPITGFILGEGWRGETFYGRNRIKEINDPNHLMEFLNQPGPEYVIVEQARFNNLRQAVNGTHNIRLVDQSSNKFYLVEVQ